MSSLSPCPVFIDGEWRAQHANVTSSVYNPSRGEVIAEVPMCGADVVNEAVGSAAAAFPAWRETPAVERARVFFRYRQLVEENFDRICQSITREHGKTLAEARGSAYRGIENIEYACGVPTLLMGDNLENLARVFFRYRQLVEENFDRICQSITREHGKTLAEARGSAYRGIENIEYACGVPTLLMGDMLENLARSVDCETLLQPLGVCVGITPFNFPAMVPMWMFPLAVACANTFVLKPSEKVPLTVVMIIQLLEKAGLPKGVLNLVHGGRDCVDALLTHPKVKAISFVGSSPVAKYIFENGTRHGK